ncbi:MAG: RdgB/HAM1 family non-canonical purine NTP pyrophosphatase [Neisseriaceae bacterium]|nr:RdgB/HAM1 family non-canonical purine NTP pyrophosphatase [Neisseriaceae bacterium]
MFDTIVMASNNAGKLKEFGALLAQYGVHLTAQSALNVPECPEPHLTFIENALAKARHASQHTGLPALADDSGICATALNGAPGIYSARYAGEHPKSDAANNHKLAQDLAEHANKEVWYACVLVLVRHPEDPLPIIAEGMWRGEFIATPQGQNGFGYDPHFYLPEHGLSAAEMAPELKNTLSHRGHAMSVLMQKLNALYGR